MNALKMVGVGACGASGVFGIAYGIYLFGIGLAQYKIAMRWEGAGFFVGGLVLYYLALKIWEK